MSGVPSLVSQAAAFGSEKRLHGCPQEPDCCNLFALARRLPDHALPRLINSANATPNPTSRL